MSFQLMTAINDLLDGPDIGTETDVSALTRSEQTATVNHFHDAVIDAPASILDDMVFERALSLIKHLAALDSSNLMRLLTALCDPLRLEVDETAAETEAMATREHGPVLERLAFLLARFVVEAEKMASDAAVTTSPKKGRATGKGKAATTAASKKKAAAAARDDYDWSTAAPRVLALMAHALTLRTDKIWTLTSERKAFVSCFIKSANVLTERPTYMKVQPIRRGVLDIFIAATIKHGMDEDIQDTILSVHLFYEHMPEALAELVVRLAKDHDHTATCDELLRKIAAKSFSASSDQTKSTKAYSEFIAKIAAQAPRLVHKQIASLQKLLDSEAYQMRNAMVEVIGSIVKELARQLCEPDANEGQDPAQIGRQISNFFDLLYDRFLDANAFVRSKVTNVFRELLDIPRPFGPMRVRVTELAIQALRDKGSINRKNAIACLSRLILTHPFGAIYGGDLDRDKWQARYDETKKEIDALNLLVVPPAVEAVPAADAEAGGDAEMEDVKPVVADEAASEDGDKTTDTDMADGQALIQDYAAVSQVQEQILSGTQVEDLERLGRLSKYQADAISWIDLLADAFAPIEELLASVGKAETLAAIDFFCAAHQYQLKQSESGVKRMLHLVWTKDTTTVDEGGSKIKSVRAHLLEQYADLYFKPLEDMTEDENRDRITRNLIERTYGATVAELVSLEQLLALLMAAEVPTISDEVIDRLWQLYGTSQAIDKRQRRGAIIILSMLAAPRRDIVVDHVDTLLQIGLGASGKADLQLARWSCIALRRINGSEKKVKGTIGDKTVRMPMTSPVFARLRDMLEAPTRDRAWFGMAEEALNTVYALADQPDSLCSAIVRKMADRAFAAPVQPVSRASTPLPPGTPGGGRERAETASPDRSMAATPSLRRSASQISLHQPSQPASAFELAQLLAIAGHCALKQIIHLELVERELKRAKGERDRAGAAAGDKAAAADELDQVAGSVEDDIADEIKTVRERELLYGPSSLLTIFAPMAVDVCAQKKFWRSPTLMIAAVTALSKFMCVSPQFCDDHLELLFTIMAQSPDPIVKGNLIIALGDIAVSWSTIMDAKSDELYRGLLDKDLTVRKHTFMVLTHLILNQMIKTKGQLGGMAKCLEDDEPRIRDLAQLFFSELATKDNVIYNELPDIISSLSVGEHEVDEATFTKIVTFIFKYIEKEKHSEGLVEKLCSRFQHADDVRQWRDLACCLSLCLYKGEKSLRKLVEALPLYQDKLHDEQVDKHFHVILTKVRAGKAGKNEQDIAEFEKALQEARDKGKDEKDMEKRAQKTTRRVATRKPAARAPAKKRARRVVEESESSEESE